MWNDQSNAGGGFFSSPNQFGATTPGQQGGQKSGKRSSRTAPIVIRQALHSGDDGVCIFDTNIQIVSVVARVRSVRVQSTKVTYTIQDMTGRMKAVLWLDQDSGEDDEKGIPKVEVNSYIQIFGTVKSNRGRKVLMAFKIIPIEDVNAITFHYLQCINNKVTLEAESKKEKAPSSVNGNFNGGLPSNSLMGVGEMNGASANGLNNRQTMVYNLIRASTLEQGTSKQDMYAQLKDRMSEMEFDNILEWMCGEGHIYSTIDEEHFRATDS